MSAYENTPYVVKVYENDWPAVSSPESKMGPFTGSTLVMLCARPSTSKIQVTFVFALITMNELLGQWIVNVVNASVVVVVVVVGSVVAPATVEPAAVTVGGNVVVPPSATRINATLVLFSRS